jgi:colanic acid/amylovoran biosynthesis glycosyltransferase
VGDRGARVGYVVSRFPAVSETFVLRELDAVAARPGIEVELFSLFPARDKTVHPSARPWVERLHRATPAGSALALLYWLVRRPVRTLGSLTAIVAGHARSPGRLVRSLAAAAAGAQHARSLGPLGVDHLHAHFASYPALAVWMCRRLTGVPYSFTGHAVDLYVDQSFLERKVREAAFVVAISEFNRRFMSDYGGDSATPVHVVHCGIRPDAYLFRPRRPPADGPVRAVCVASFIEHKGHRVLFEALAAGGEELGRIELDLVGGRELREPLERLAESLGIADRVRFLGTLPEQEVAALLDRADLFVLPSLIAGDRRMEGLPVALMEALAAGLCTVTTRLSGIPELVRDGETGILAEQGDPGSMRDALGRALSGACTEATAKAARALVEREFDIERSATALAALFSRQTQPSAERSTSS